VCLIERAGFPRSRLGESLTPGIWSIAGMIGVRSAIEGAGFTRVRTVSVHWGRGEEERHDPSGRGLLVDRGRFDQLLVEQARSLGVRVLQPATVRERRQAGGEWRLKIDSTGRTIDLGASFVADASGRAGWLPGLRRRTGPRTVALHAYWRGAGLPVTPRVEAGADAWYWSVPLPDGRCNALAFLSPRAVRAARTRAIDTLYLHIIERSRLLAACRDATLDGRVHVVDATPQLADDPVTPRSILVGDAALALDPLSSSGVQKAMQNALSGAVVVNTLLRRPELAGAAMAFHRSSLTASSERHRAWAASHYSTVADVRPGDFWKERASAAPPTERTDEAPVDMDARATLSSRAEIVDEPCLDGDFVAVRPALRHPGLDGAVAYLGGWELAPLLRGLTPGMTPREAALAWSDRMPLPSALAITAWLSRHGIFVPDRGPRL
jgi:2-polyprenyl-6-methoxyphenol hydroxylase-like FAD-dependent oxidoreductase